MSNTHYDFEGKELRLGDVVLTVDLDRRGGFIRRGEVVKLCPSAVKIRITRKDTKDTEDILRGDNWIALVERNPQREAELSNPTTII